MPKKNNMQISKADERQIVTDLEGLGYRARRQPGSGNRDITLQDDVVWLDSPVGELHVEAKYRQECAWKTLVKWKSGAEILSVRCDDRFGHQDGQRMVFMSWKLLLELVGSSAVCVPKGFEEHTMLVPSRLKSKIRSAPFPKSQRKLQSRPMRGK